MHSLMICIFQRTLILTICLVDCVFLYLQFNVSSSKVISVSAFVPVPLDYIHVYTSRNFVQFKKQV